MADGTSPSVRVRPSSSARPEVWFSENIGSPVTAKSVAAQINGPAAVIAA